MVSVNKMYEMDHEKLSFSSQNGVRRNVLSNEVAKYLLVSGLVIQW